MPGDFFFFLYVIADSLFPRFFLWIFIAVLWYLFSAFHSAVVSGYPPCFRDLFHATCFIPHACFLRLWFFLFFFFFFSLFFFFSSFLFFCISFSRRICLSPIWNLRFHFPWPPFFRAFFRFDFFLFICTPSVSIIVIALIGHCVFLPFIVFFLSFSPLFFGCVYSIFFLLFFSSFSVRRIRPSFPSFSVPILSHDFFTPFGGYSLYSRIRWIAGDLLGSNIHLFSRRLPVAAAQAPLHTGIGFLQTPCRPLDTDHVRAFVVFSPGCSVILIVIPVHAACFAMIDVIFLASRFITILYQAVIFARDGPQSMYELVRFLYHRSYTFRARGGIVPQFSPLCCLVWPSETEVAVSLLSF